MQKSNISPPVISEQKRGRQKCLRPGGVKRHAKGVILLEALISAILLIVGIFGVLKMVSSSAVTVTDTEFRALALERSVEMMEQIRIGVNRSGGKSQAAANVQNSLRGFVHQPSGNKCGEFSGEESRNAAVGLWLERLIRGTDKDGRGADASTRLPGVKAEGVQISYDPAKNNLVTITVCWKGPNDQVDRRHELSAHIH